MTELRTIHASRDVARLLSATAIIGAVALTGSPAYAQNDDIVVTARKVEENIQDVPISITAFTGETFEEAGLTEFADVASITPNLNIRPNGATGSTYATVTLRGQSAGFLTLNADQAVGIYIDGAPITRGTALSSLFDVDRVEILRGPQGTLYGKNTTGGAVSIVTRAPQLNDLGGYAQLTLGSFERRDTQVVVNIPLIEDQMAVRFGVSSAQREGFGEGLQSGRELADDNEITFRGSLLYEPSRTVSFRLNAEYHEAEEAGPINRSLRNVFGGFLALRTANPDIYFGNDLGVSPSNADSRDWNVNGTLSVDLGGATFESITSYRDQVAEINFQASPATGIDLAQDSHIFAQELHLTGSAMNDRFDWLVGAFYSDESGIDQDFLPGFGVFQKTGARNEGWSIFTQNSYAFTDALRVTLGLRYTDEEREVTDLAAGAPIPVRAVNFDGWSWLASVDYRFSPAVLTYASVSRGFRSGGIDQDNLATVVQPEFVTNYEVGVKADLWDDRLRVNLALYYSDYTDIQRTTFDPNNFPSTILRNAAVATLQGFELEVTATPVTGLTLSGTVGHTDGQYDEFLDAGTDRSDEPIGGPQWQYSLAGRYEFAVSGSARLGLQANYFWLDETPLTSAAVAAALAQGEATLDSVGLLNAQVDLEMDVFEGLNIAFFGTNILDEDYSVSGIVVPIVPPTEVVSNRTTGEPATFGVRVTQSF